MADSNFTATKRIPTRPLSLDHKSKAENKEVLVDYENGLIYVKKSNGSVVCTNREREAYLEWGGRNLSGSVTPIGASLSSEHSANRIAYLNPDAITIEYSNDAGSTWVDSELDDSRKINLVTKSDTIYIGSNSTVTTNHRTRITLTAQDGTTGYVYTRPRKMLINVSDAGHGLRVKIDAKSGASDASWYTLGTYELDGWSGWNDIPMSIANFGGSKTQTTNNWYMRLTFEITSVNSSYSTTKSSILGLRLFGDTCWTSTSNMGETGHLYSYDASQNATFPAQVSATTFNGNLSGNVNGNLSGNATTATKLHSSVKIGEVSFDGSSNISLDQIAGRATLKSSSGSYKNQYTKFARIDVSSGAYACRSGTLEFCSKEAPNIFGELVYYFRSTNTIANTTKQLYWKTLNNITYANCISAVKVSDGVYDLYFKSLSTYETITVTNINSCSNLNTSITFYDDQAYTQTITADTVSSLLNIASSADKATKDASGNVITSTYETKSDSTSKLAEAKTYADNLLNKDITVSGDATFASGKQVNLNGTTKIVDADVTTLDVSGTTNLKNTTIGGTTTATGAATFNGGATFASGKQVNLNGTTKITDADVTTLDVSGNATVTGTTTATGAATFNGGATFAANKQVNLNGTTKITDADVTTLDVSGTTNLKNTTITGTASITGNTTIGGTVTATGAATFNGGATFAAAKQVNLNGTTKIADADVTTLDVSGNATVTGTTTMTGAATFNGGATFASGKQVNLNGTTKITDADVTTLDVSGNATVTGTTTATGAATFNGGATFASGKQVNLNGTTKITDADVTTLDVSGNATFNNVEINGEVTSINSYTNFTSEVDFDSNTIFAADAEFMGAVLFNGDAEFSGNVNGVSVVYNATIGTSWTTHSDGYVYQTITVSGVKSTDVPIVDINLSDVTFANKNSAIEAYSKIYRITTANNSITVYADEATTTPINIQLKVTR